MSLTDIATPTVEQSHERRTIEYTLDDEEIDVALSIADERHQSYKDGRTRDEDWCNSKEAMRKGTIAEMVCHVVYPEYEFDDSISASGDDGIDGDLRLDGDEMTVDVKARDLDPETFHAEVELLVARHHIDERQNTPDAYVGAYVSDDYSTVRLYGWVETDRLLDDGRIEEARDPDADHDNYVLDFSDLLELPEHHNVDDEPNATVRYL
jgi:hypothetical protein